MKNIKPVFFLLVAALLMAGCASKALRDNEGNLEDKNVDKMSAETQSKQSTPGSTKGLPPNASPGKLQAPVEIDAVLNASGGILSLDPKNSATSVDVRIWIVGKGHRLVSKKHPLADVVLKEGELREIEVKYQLTEGPARLTVALEGNFGSRRLARIKTFTIRGGDTEKAPGEIREDHQGEKIHLMGGH